MFEMLCLIQMSRLFVSDFVTLIIHAKKMVPIRNDITLKSCRFFQ